MTYDAKDLVRTLESRMDGNVRIRRHGRVLVFEKDAPEKTEGGRTFTAKETMTVSGALARMDLLGADAACAEITEAMGMLLDASIRSFAGCAGCRYGLL